MRKNLLSIITLFIFSSCSTQFEEITKYLELDNEQEKIDMVNGIYTRLIRIHDHNYFLMCCRSDDINFYDDFEVKAGNPNFYISRNGGSCRTTSGNGSSEELNETIIGEIYINLYKAIVNANYLICKLPVNDNSRLLGEVYFLRAYCYFKLARFFGKPPLVEDIDVNYLLEKPGYADVYHFIEGDLLMAADLLPDSYSNSRVPGETPHAGTAKALLAEVYLTMAGYPLNDQSKYTDAARLAKEVIDNAARFNFELSPDIASLIVKADEHCNEHIFTLFNKQPENILNDNLDYFYFHLIDEPVFWYLNQFFIPQFKFYKNFPKNYRKSIFIKTGHYRRETKTLQDSTIINWYFEECDPLYNPCRYINGIAYLKYMKLEDFENYEDTQDTEYKNGNVNLYLLRYAQTLLTYAEAKARSGNLDPSAFEAVNMVRRRANKLDINTHSAFDLPKNLSPEQFIDSVVWERAWELCFEPDGRWFDIVRLDMKDRLPELRYSFDIPSTIDSRLLSKEWYFYKIPQEDRWLNPNLNE